MPPPAYRSSNFAYPPPTHHRPYPAAPNFVRPYPNNVLRPVNNQYRPQPIAQKMQSVIHKVPSRPPPIAPRVQPRPPLPMPTEPPLHMRHNVERVVYKKPEQTQSAVVVPVPPSPSPSQVSLGSEKVVYRNSERVIYNGNGSKEIIEVLASSESSSTLVSSQSCITISDSSAYTDEKESLAGATSNAPRQVVYDRESEAKISVTIKGHTPPTSNRNPQDIRTELRALRKRFAMMDITKELINEGGLSCFITSADVQIPQPNMTNDPTWFDIKILGLESPDKFTFQFGFTAVEELQNNMKEFYDCIEETGTYLAKNLAVNMVVAVSHSNRWYRAQVKSFDDTLGGYAEIIPLDCMSLKPKKLLRTDIQYLHKKFTEESQKSAYGRIFGILPKENEYEESVTEEVAKLKGQRHQATIKIFEDNVYHLSVIADSKTRLRIIDLLIQQDMIKLESKCFTGPAKNVNMSLK